MSDYVSNSKASNISLKYRNLDEEAVEELRCILKSNGGHIYMDDPNTDRCYAYTYIEDGEVAPKEVALDGIVLYTDGDICLEVSGSEDRYNLTSWNQVLITQTLRNIFSWLEENI